jgi:triacylglycerol lipase
MTSSSSCIHVQHVLFVLLAVLCAMYLIGIPAYNKSTTATEIIQGETMKEEILTVEQDTLIDSHSTSTVTVNEDEMSLSQRELFAYQLQYLTETLQQQIEDGYSKNKIGMFLNSTYLNSINYVHHPTMNVTSQFDQLLIDVRDGKHVLSDDAQNYVYVLVPGLFTSFYPGYLKRNIKVLTQLNLEILVVPLKDKSVLDNGKMIRDFIIEKVPSDKQVVIIGHSKGAVDAYAAIVLYPEIKKVVKAFVSVQGPIAGTAFPNDIVNHEPSRQFLGAIIEKLLQGHPDALADMAYEKRHNFLKKYPFPACTGCEEVPCDGIRTLSFATSSSSPLSLMASSVQYVKIRYSENSDGLVTTKDSIIPGSRVIYVDELDHAAPCFEFFPNVSGSDPGELFVALIAMALQDTIQCVPLDHTKFELNTSKI